MRSIILAACSFFVLAAAPANGAVRAQAANGFTVEQTVEIAAPAPRVFATLLRPAQWWQAAHTYSGRAQSLSLQPRAGGCFCERWPGGEVEHMRVAQLLPNSSLRLLGGLGPLQGIAEGVLTVTLQAAPAGGTRATLEYRVWGQEAADFSQLAPVVDQVLGEQLSGLKAAVEAKPGAR